MRAALTAIRIAAVAGAAHLALDGAVATARGSTTPPRDAASSRSTAAR